MATDLVKLRTTLAKLLADNTFDDAINGDAANLARQMTLEDVQKAATNAADLARFIGGRAITSGYVSPIITALDAFVRAADNVIEQEAEG